MRPSIWVASLLLMAERSLGARIPSKEAELRPRAGDKPVPPTFPHSYEMQYTLYIPYVEAIQTAGLRYPVHLWYDEKGQRLRVDVYNALDSVYILPDSTYNVFPRISKKTCCMANTSDYGKENSLSNPLPDISDWTFAGETMVNDVAAYAWQLVEKHETKVNTYTFYTSQHSESPLKLYMIGVNLFTGSHFDEYIAEFSIFRRLSDITTDAAFKPPLSCNHPMRPPALDHRLLSAQVMSLLPSSNVGSQRQTWGAQRQGLDAQGQVLDAQQHQALGVQQQQLRFQQRLVAGQEQGVQEQAAELEGDLFEASREFVESWNAAHADEKRFKLATNKFSGWSQERFEATSLGLGTKRAPYTSSSSSTSSSRASSSAPSSASSTPHVSATAVSDSGSSTSGGSSESRASSTLASDSTSHVSETTASDSTSHTSDTTAFDSGSSASDSDSRKTGSSAPSDSQSGGMPSALRKFQRRLSNVDLPRDVDWRGTGADGFVKDQVSCGSCWAFAAVGAMQGAWFVATGEVVSLSEQQMVDCAWDFGANGCWGGLVEHALDIVVAAGGAASEELYPYLAQNSYCKINKTSKAANFVGYEAVDSGDEFALMEAVYTRGPVAVSLDAGHPTFKYYSEGVYHREDCGMDEDHLNHAVTLVGYGTTDYGEDYWLIRNSWSKYWGSDGYMKITRHHNDCGVSTHPIIAVVGIA